MNEAFLVAILAVLVAEEERPKPIETVRILRGGSSTPAPTPTGLNAFQTDAFQNDAFE